MSMFDTVLVANRGEIALRVIRTAHRMGIRTVAVYSDADRDAPHVRAADEAVLFGPPPPRCCYLHVPNIVEAMKLKNPIVADEDGVVAEVLVQNAESVEYDQVLMLLRRRT